MMTLDQLYERAWDEGIEIDEVPMRAVRAMAFPEGWIAMDSNKYESLIDFKCDLAHEIGHCETGSYYNIYSPFDLRVRCERKANRRAIEILMPLHEVQAALRKGCRMAWALAEWFEVSQNFAHMALKMYGEELQRLENKKIAGLPQMMRASELLTNPKRRIVDMSNVDRDMETLRRLGILNADWRRDPLLNLPDYDY